MSDYNIDEDIIKKEKEKIEQENTLKSEITYIDESLKEFEKETNSELDEFKTRKNSIKEKFQNLNEKATESIKDIEDLTGKNLRRSVNVAARITKWFSYSILIFSVIFLFIFFNFFYEQPTENVYFVISGYGFDQNTCLILGTIFGADVILLTIIRLCLSSVRKKIDKDKLEMVQDVKLVTDKKPVIFDDDFKDSKHLTNFLSRVSIFDSNLKKIVGDSRSFISFVDSLFITIARRNLQKQYRRSMRNTLSMYGLYDDPPELLMLEIDSLSTPDDEESLWLNDASKKVSNALFSFVDIKLSPQVIKMMYYDYTNQNQINNEWVDIKNDLNMCKQLAYVLTSRVLKKDVFGDDGALIELIQNSDPFSLKSFQKGYLDFAIDFKHKKSCMKTVVSLLGFLGEDIFTKIDNFYPSTMNSVTWDEEFVKKIAKEIGFNDDHLFLFYYDRLGYSDKRDEKWKGIREPEKFSQFTDQLNSKNLLAIPQKYMQQDCSQIIRRLANKQPFFDFNLFNGFIQSYFKTIDDEKDRIIRILENLDSKFVSSDFRDAFGFYLPVCEDVLDDFATFVSKELPIDYDILLLFYGEKYDQMLCDRCYSNLIPRQALMLANFLIDHNKIRVNESDNPENLSDILKIILTFDLTQIQNLYEQYSVFADLSRKMHEFYASEEVIITPALSYAELISIIKASGEGRLNKILGISNKLVSTNPEFDSNAKSVSRACCCLFLYSQSDTDSGKLCENILTDDVACDILYHNMNSKVDQGLVSGKILFRQIISESLPPTDLDRKLMPIFLDGLKHRILYHNKTEMMQKQSANVGDEMENLSDIKQELSEMRESVKSVLDEEITSNDTLMQYAVQSQIIQAYVVTKKGQSRSLPLLQDKAELQEAAEKINLGMPVDDFLILGDDENTPGYGTRLGIVPLNMDFAEFSKKFNSLYETAIDALVGNDVSLKAKYHINMIRIMTSDATFNAVRFVQTDEQELYEIIENLLKDNFSNSDKIQLIATFQTDTGKVGVRNILEKTFNKIPLYDHVGKSLIPIMDASRIESAMRIDSFDDQLYRSYGVENFTQLCRQIHKSRQNSDDVRLTNVLDSHLAALLQKHDSMITEQDSMNVSKVLFQKLTKFGRVLSS